VEQIGMILPGLGFGGKMTDGSDGWGRSADRSLWIFAGASLLAVAAGCVVASAAGVGINSWVRNLIAWVLGAGLAFAISRRPTPAWLVVPVAAAAIIGLAATFINEDQEGVYRWWDVGPLHVNAAALILPLTIVALAQAGASLIFVSVVSVVLAAQLAAQPDASHATAIAAAMAAAIGLRGDQPGWRWIVVAALALIGGASWLRPDPLEPVPEVEEIVQLAWRIAPIAGILGVAGLIGATLAPLAGVRPLRPEALALSLYIAIVALAPALGAFPVPLMGVGMSPVLGLWLGIGLLAAAPRPST
jgi:hypothetical protein